MQSQLNSFTENAKVLLTNGKTTNIASVKPGEFVMSYNPKTRQFFPNLVLANTHYMIYKVYVINNYTLTGPGETFYVYSSGTGAYVPTPASDLVVGDYLLNPTNNSNVRVNSLKIYNGTGVVVYDIVLAGGNSFIVNGLLTDQ